MATQNVLSTMLAPFASILTCLKTLSDEAESNSAIFAQVATMVMAVLGFNLAAAQVNILLPAMKASDDLIDLLAALANNQPVTAAQVQAALTDLGAACPLLAPILSNPQAVAFINNLVVQG